MNSKVFTFHNAEIAILRVDDWMSEIPQKVTSEYKKNSKRSIEKAITQHLLLTHLPNQRLCYNSNGKPYLKDGGYISISHSNSLIGIAWSFDYNIGLDIEEVNDRIFRVENRFISEKEMTFAKSLLDKLTVWSLKEVLIKINDDKSLNLKTDLIIERANENQWRGWTSKKPQEVHDFITFEYCNNIVCINKASER